MKIVYTGPHADGVVLYPDNGGELVATHGDPIDVPDALGASLLEQPANWQPAKAPANKPAPTGGKD